MTIEFAKCIEMYTKIFLLYIDCASKFMTVKINLLRN